jgi:hypothetical protein
VANQLNLSQMDMDARLGPCTRNGHRKVHWRAAQWIMTSERAMVALSGDRNFRVCFCGTIIHEDANGRYVM